MSRPADGEPQAVRLVADEAALGGLIATCRHADELALDVESNGLHAYRPRLCVLQLAWRSDDGLQVAIVDCAATDVRPLASLLGPDGPTKLVHDVSFDAQLLRDHQIVLGPVRDTAVAALLLGEPATGLARLADQWLGVKLDKRLQSHDWATRPLTKPQLDYLAGDVRHLFALADHLWARAGELDVVEEISVECAYRLASALRSESEATEAERPFFARIKGYAALDGRARAVLDRLARARDRISRELDRPPFRVARDAWLLEVARRRPRSEAALATVAKRGRPHRRHDRVWLAAVERGCQDRPIETDSRPADREQVARRAQVRALRSRINRWRRAEAQRRGVDAQAVLPGHCARDLAQAMADWQAAGGGDLRAAISSIDGLGRKRAERYADGWLRLARDAAHDASKGSRGSTSGGGA